MGAVLSILNEIRDCMHNLFSCAILILCFTMCIIATILSGKIVDVLKLLVVQLAVAAAVVTCILNRATRLKSNLEDILASVGEHGEQISANLAATEKELGQEIEKLEHKLDEQIIESSQCIRKEVGDANRQIECLSSVMHATGQKLSDMDKRMDNMIHKKDKELANLWKLINMFVEANGGNTSSRAFENSTPEMRPAKKKFVEKVGSASSAIKRPLIDETLLSSLPEYYCKVHDVLMLQPSDYTSYILPFPEGLFGIEGHIALTISDIVDIYKNDHLNVSILQIWCMFWNYRMDTMSTKRFRFMDPSICGEAAVDLDLVGTICYMIEFVMTVKENEYVFVPYNTPSHWILLLVHFHSSTIYYIDSLDSVLDEITFTLKLPLNIATRFYWQRNMTGVGQLSPMRFVKIPGPIQKGDKACGYYVMRFMLDIIEKYKFEGFPQSLEPLHVEYPMEKIEEAKKLLLEFILRLF